MNLPLFLGLLIYMLHILMPLYLVNLDAVVSVYVIPQAKSWTFRVFSGPREISFEKETVYPCSKVIESYIYHPYLMKMMMATNAATMCQARIIIGGS